MSGEACGTVGRQSHGFLSLDQPFHRLSLGFLLHPYIPYLHIMINKVYNLKV